MRFEVDIKKSCEGIFECITPDSIFNAIVTLLGIFLTAGITYLLTKRQNIHEYKLNYQEFYKTIDNSMFWITQLSDRLNKISKINFNSIEDLDYHKDILEYNVKQIAFKLNIENAPHAVKENLLDIQSCALQSVGYYNELIENMNNENNMNNTSKPKEYFKTLNKKVKNNTIKLKKYI